MSKQLTPLKSFLLLAAIFLTNIAYMNDMIIIPAVAQLYEQFPTQTGIVNFIVSGPALLMMFSMLASAKLMQKFSKKNLIIVSLIIFCIAGGFAVLKLNVFFIAAARAIIGIATGVVSACGVALISEVYTDEKKRGLFLGLNTAAMTAIGAIISVVAGSIATNAGWAAAFKLYWVTIPIIALCLIGLPSIRPGRSLEEGEELSEVKPKTKFPLKNILLVILTFTIFATVYSVIYFQVSIYINENSIGSATTAGIISSLGMIGSMVASAAFGLIYAKINRASMFIVSSLLGLSLILMYFINSVVITAISCILIGGSFGIGFSCLLMEATVLVPKEHIDTSIAIASAIGAVSQFLSTYLAQTLRSILHVDTLTAILPALAIIAFAVTAVEIFNFIKTKDKRKKPAVQGEV